MRKIRRPNRPASPAGVANVPQPSTSSQAPLITSPSTPSESPMLVLQQPSNAPSDRRGNVKDDALDIAIAITSVGKDAAGVLNVPGLAPALSALLEILKKIQLMSKTVKGINALTQDISHLVKAAKSFSERNSGKEIPKALMEAIDELTSKWAETEKHATELAKRNRVRRFLGSASDAKKLEDLVGDIRSSIQNAMPRAGWDTQMLTYEIQQTLNAMADKQDEEFVPPHAEGAAYDANSARPRQPCLEGTREDILEDGWTWIKLRTRYPVSTNDTQGRGVLTGTEEAQGFIHWTCGLAGTGKTTIACSIAQRCKDEGILGASFFFSRFDSKCDNPRLLFTTISRQLCRVHPAYRAKVVQIMKSNPDIVNSIAAVQFEKLILEPLERLTEPFPRLTIVVDALDECHSDDNTSTIFYILSRFKDRVARFLLFILTSRPEPDIVAHFDQTRSGPLGEVTMRLVLHMVQLEPVLQDIRRFLTWHLKKTLDRRVPRGWPADEQIVTLSNLSEGLFIFARTAVNLIMDRNSIDPVKTLERVILRQSRRSHTASILGELYLQVLEESHAKAGEQFQVSTRRIFGALVVAAEPLSVTTLAGLLDLSEGLVWDVLSQLFSVLHIPDNDSEPIYFIHPTFPEFLLQVSSASSRPRPPRFAIEASKQHRAVFVRTLKTMGRYLRYDIANLQDPSAFKEEIPDLQARIQKDIPPHLSYACRNWSVHLRRSRKRLGPQVFRMFRWFLRKHLLHWLEAVSLLDMLGEAPYFLDVARRICQSLEKLFSRLAPFLFDARRFALTYMTSINTAPLQVYHSALGCAPNTSLIAQTYSDVQLKQSLAVCRGELQEWGPGLDAVTSHRGEPVYAVAFSPDNTFFVSGGKDGMVEVWQTSTRVLVLRIQTSSQHIWTVAYSPSGLHIAIGGKKGLSIWHAASGTQIRVITDDIIKHATYTADGSRLLSVSFCGKLQMWHVSDGECHFSLGVDGWMQASVSWDGEVVAYTRGACLLLLSASFWMCEGLELPDLGRGAAFSPGGRYVAAATFSVIQIWSCQDKVLVRSIDAPDAIWCRLSFSPDGSRICCGSDHGAIYVWLVEGNGIARELKGHTDVVRDIAWSSDGSQIVSSSEDGTIRLWDVTDHPLPKRPHAVQPTKRSSGPPRVLVAEYDGDFRVLDLPLQPVTSLFPPSYDGPIFTTHPSRVAAWNHIIYSGGAWLPKAAYRWVALTGQSGSSSEATIAVSNDGSLVAYAVAKDISVRSLTTGELVATLAPDSESGSGDICSIVFSPDDSHLASGSVSPAMVAVWDVTRGACVTYHHDHLDSVCVVAFSSDGRFVASGSRDNTARVFDIPTKQVTHVLGPHNNSVMHVMLTTDNRLLVALDAFGYPYVWDVETGSEIISSPSSDESLAFHASLTGFSVSTNDGEFTVELWKAGHRTWPVYGISEEGWVYAEGPGYVHRLMWLPPDWRHPVFSDGATLYVCEVEEERHSKQFIRMGNIIELDMSRLLDHAPLQ